jgi:TatD DNase family protein
MKIDIHRHTINNDISVQAVRNLFHSQTGEIENQKLYSVGLHPWHVKEETLQNDIEEVRKIANHPQIIAIGEAGLDKTIDVPLTIQQKAFLDQIEIARDVNKPMIIHCVKAYNEIAELKTHSKHTCPWIVHWFNSNFEMAMQLVEKDFYLSFGIMLFKEESKAFKAFTRLPIERIFLETDDTVYSIEEIYSKASSMLGLSVETMEAQINKNFKDCFDIKL